MTSMKKVERRGTGLAFSNGHWDASFEAGALNFRAIRLEPQIVLTENGRETAIEAKDCKVAIDDGLLARVIATGHSPQGHSLRITYDIHQTENLHVYVRLSWGKHVRLDAVELPRLRTSNVDMLRTGRV